MEDFRVIIAGGRDFNDYGLLKRKCDKILENKESVIVVSGKAKGADSLGEEYAKEKGHKIDSYPADWNDMNEPCVVRKRKDGSEYNVLAGHNRNQKMADVADALIAFWNEKSSGTKDMIDRANKKGIPVRIVKYKT